MLITMGILYLMTKPTTTITRLTSTYLSTHLSPTTQQITQFLLVSAVDLVFLLYCSTWCSWCGIGGKPLVASGTEEPVAICDPDKPCDEPVDTTA